VLDAVSATATGDAPAPRLIREWGTEKGEGVVAAELDDLF
jgi:hypothetical protein